MSSSLPAPLRRQLGSAITDAREIAERGASKALKALAVHEVDPYRHMNDEQRHLRRQLRAQARQLGDSESTTNRGTYEIKHLVEKLAYDQWHRLLFARFLLENNLLISPEHAVSVSLDDCEELAPSLGLKDSWAVAARFAAKELPEIFRTDDPASGVGLPSEDRKPLIELVTALPPEVFKASDSLGWCYQFWQAERKDEVNDSGRKIGADELPAVTQLFTEDYMVDFLLDNTLGAWHASKVLEAKPTLAEGAQNEDELRSAVSLPRCPWKYLRFVQTENGRWILGAGTFSDWPREAKNLRCLDPCMGSGHFVVAMFERLVALRMAEEPLDEAVAVAAVIRDNLFGLEIDPRCTQIGAFNLALAAWRRVGQCRLPAMNLACSGLAPNSSEADWLAIAGNDEKLKSGMARLYRLFENAPVLGSLVNPRAVGGDLFEAGFNELEPLLEEALARETDDDRAHEMTVTARGLAKAAEMLAARFTLTATNVPYLARGKQTDTLKDFGERFAKDAKSDLATLFLQRGLDFCCEGGTSALVTPQSWLFLGSYRSLRERLLKSVTVELVAPLGVKAFQTPMWDFNVLLVITTKAKAVDGDMSGIDVSDERGPVEKDLALRTGPLVRIERSRQRLNVDSRITLSPGSSIHLLAEFVECHQGLATGDLRRFGISFWEVPRFGQQWVAWQGTVDATMNYGGRSGALLWEEGRGQLHAFNEAHKAVRKNTHLRGSHVRGRRGVLVTQMGALPTTLYTGDHYDDNTTVLFPKREEHLPAIWAFCSSSEYAASVRACDASLKVPANTLAKIPFDLAQWERVATERYPEGLPRPYSNDSTQWLFSGHPNGSNQPLHVSIARLLGYRWPRQTGSSFLDCPAVAPDGLEPLVDSDGIACLSATKGEAPAHERLHALLVQALGKVDVGLLLGGAGPKGSKSETLKEWLRDEFFEQHCALFHHRPFIWHIWDGHRNGFSALVNYHQLNHANLEKLTYSYLGDWMRREQAAVDAGEAGSDVRLQAAKQLQVRLKLILEGDPPFDLFARWKPLSSQAIGWQPDLSDGVRINIRPFLARDIPGGKKGAGILRTKPNIKWDKDRGEEPVRDKNEFPWFWGWNEETQDFAGVGTEPDGNRWNDCHYSNEFKRKHGKG